MIRKTKFPGQDKKTVARVTSYIPYAAKSTFTSTVPSCPYRVTLTLLPQKCTPRSQIPLQGVTMPTTIYSTALHSTPKQLCLNIFHYIVTGCNPSPFRSCPFQHYSFLQTPYVTTISLTAQFIASCLASPLLQSQPACPPHSFRYQLPRPYTMEATHPFVLNKKIQISLLLRQICCF